MGHTVAEVCLYSSRDLSKHLKLKFLVDTASTYTWVKPDKLEKLDVKPITKWKFKTIDGKIIERETGEVPIECLNERATTIVVFAEDEDAEVLVVYSLEGLRLEVDPITKQLKKAEALLAF